MLKYFITLLFFTSFLTAVDKPNILYIAIDDLNDWITPLGGNSQAITPNFDRLAKMGITFTNAHTAASACHPSRIANLTGVRPSRSGIVRNDFNYKLTNGKPAWRLNPILKDVITLPRFFKNNGYDVIGGGKIYHSLQWSPGSMIDRSDWNSYFPSFEQTIPTWPRPEMSLYRSPKWTEKRPLGKNGRFGWEPLKEKDEETSDYKVVEWASKELFKKRNKPFFLAAGIFRPHIPWEVPQKYFDLYPLDSVKLPEDDSGDLKDAWDHNRRNWHQWVLDNKEWKRAVRGYLASISYADAMLGKLLDAYEKSGRDKDTILMLWSDHGMHIGEKQNWEKFTCWEESTRIPMFAIVPGVTKPGSVCRKAVSAFDFYPTLVELSGFDASPLQGQLDGESLIPLFKNPQAKRVQPAVTAYLNVDSVRTDKWRYIYYKKLQLEELYNHQVDPSERTNLAYNPKYLNKLQELRKQLNAWTGIKPTEGTPVVPKGYRLLGDSISKVDFKVIKTKQ